MDQTAVSVVIGLATIIVSVVLALFAGDLAAAKHSERVAWELEEARLTWERYQLNVLLDQFLVMQLEVTEQLLAYVRAIDDADVPEEPRLPPLRFDGDALRALTTNPALGAPAQVVRSLVVLPHKMTIANTVLSEGHDALSEPLRRVEFREHLAEIHSLLMRVREWQVGRLKAIVSEITKSPRRRWWQWWG